AKYMKLKDLNFFILQCFAYGFVSDNSKVELYGDESGDSGAIFIKGITVVPGKISELGVMWISRYILEKVS
ncbi:hypothetical protein ACI3QN_12825, partial [Propionibacterium freudenreichii]|uniref:hypothetical protein n=1 Tax=Propionibacterium freudenreichii TaxID=1744 RepID=UPI003853C7CF